MSASSRSSDDIWELVVEVINEEFFVHGQFLTVPLLQQIIKACAEVVDEQPQA